MPASFVSSLPRALRDAWSLVVSGVAQNLSSRKITSVLKKAGKGVRRQTLLDAIRLIKHGFASDKTLRLLPGNRVPLLGHIPKALTAIRRPFSYRFQVDGIFQDKFITRMVTLSTPERLTPDEANAIMTDKLQTDFFGYGAKMEVFNIGLVGIRRKGAAGLL